MNQVIFAAFVQVLPWLINHLENMFLLVEGFNKYVFM